MRTRLPVDRLAPVRVALGVARSCSVLLVGAVLLTAVCFVAAVAFGDDSIAALAFMFLLHFVLGLVGSFALHEAAHTLALGLLAPGIRSIDLVATGWRFSLTPRGTMSGKQAVGVALAGPLTAVAVGAVLSGVLPSAGVAFWYLGHAVFLLPPFGDGRALLSGMRRWSLPMRMPRTR